MVITNRTVDIALFALFMLAMWSPGESWPQWTELARYAVFLSVSGFIILTAYFSVGLRAQLSSEGLFVAAFLAYVALSAYWSVPAPNTYLKSLLILSALLTAMSISNLVSLDRAFRILFWALSTLVLSSVAVAVLVPSIGVETGWEHEGKWRGLLAQKNGLGALAAETVITGLALPLKRNSHGATQFWAVAGRAFIIILSALAVYMAGSRGGQLLCLVGVASLLIAQAPKLLQRVLLLATVFVSVPVINLAVSTFWIDADKIGVVGMTINTNNRTTIWEYGLRQMEGRELFGFGVNGFWTPERMTAFQDVHGWVLDNFHNGYVTLLVENGAVGFALFVLGLAFTYLLMLISIGVLKDGIVALAFAHLNTFALSNVVENVAGRSTSISIFIFSVTAFSLRHYVISALNRERNHNRSLTTSFEAGRG